MKFRKKPVVIEARQLTDETALDIAYWCNGKLTNRAQAKSKWALVIPTLEGDMLASKGDYVIQGVKGEFYPCKPDIFEATYEKVE